MPHHVSKLEAHGVSRKHCLVLLCNDFDCGRASERPLYDPNETTVSDSGHSELGTSPLRVVDRRVAPGKPEQQVWKPGEDDAHKASVPMWTSPFTDFGLRSPGASLPPARYRLAVKKKEKKGVPQRDEKASGRLVL